MPATSLLRRPSRFFWLLLPVATVLTGCAPQAGPPPKPPLQVVKYVQPVRELVTEHEEFTGRIAPVEMVELRSRVDGYLQDVKFDDGAEVKSGDILFEIDHAPFKAEVDRTKASVEQFKARVDRMTRQYERLAELVRKKAASENDFDLVRFDRAEAEASLKAAQAQYERAQLDLNYAEIKAPIDGRISRRLVDPGNLIQADTTALATIVPLDRVYIYFDMDERTVLRLRRLVQDGKLAHDYMTETYIDVALADSADFNHHGKIDFEDNQIDAATGTLRVRAVVDNEDRFLSPGMFVRIRYPIGKPNDEVLIPEEALGSDQGQPFVYVLGDDNKVAYRAVEVGPQVGARRVVRTGLTPEERVIVTGLQRIKKNQEVHPQELKPAPATVAQAQPPGEVPVLSENKKIESTQTSSAAQ